MTEEVSSKLSLLTRKLAEVGQLKGEIADKLFEEADAGIITKEQALEILDTYNLLPTDGYVSLPPIWIAMNTLNDILRLIIWTILSLRTLRKAKIYAAHSFQA